MTREKINGVPRRLGRKIEGRVVGKFACKSVLDHRDIAPLTFKEEKDGLIIGGREYGLLDDKIESDFRGFYDNIRGVLALSFQEKHRREMIEMGIIPFRLIDEGDYKILKEGDGICLDDLDLWENNYAYISNRNISVKLEIAASDYEKTLLRKCAYK